MRKIVLSAMVSLFPLAALAGDPPVQGPSTQPPCKWSKADNGALVCNSDNVIPLKAQNTFSCGMIVYSKTVRFEKFSIEVLPKKKNGDPFAMYAIKSNYDPNPAQPDYAQIAADAQNTVKDANGPRNVTADYICRVRMKIWPNG